MWKTTAGWYVTATKLYDAMAQMNQAFNRDYGDDARTFTIENFNAKAVTLQMCAINGTPQVPCVLMLAPLEAAKLVSITLAVVQNPSTVRVIKPPLSSPCAFTQDAGYYFISGDFSAHPMPPYHNYRSEPVSVMPPSFDFPLHFQRASP